MIHVTCSKLIFHYHLGPFWTGTRFSSSPYCSVRHFYQAVPERFRVHFVELLVAVRLWEWKWVNTELFRIFLETAQHNITREWNWSDVTRLVSTEHVRNKALLLSRALYTAVVINLIKLIDIVSFALSYCTELLRRWICIISTQISNKKGNFKVNYKRDIDLGEHSFSSVTFPYQSGSVHWDST